MKTRWLSCALLVLISLAAPPKAASGAAARVAPPLIRVELSSLEPALDEAGQLVVYAGTAFFKFPAPPPGIRWYKPPEGRIHPKETEALTACGFSAPPQGIVTTPGGGGLTVAPVLAEYIFGGTCSDYVFRSFYGMELGTYTILIQSPEGQLAHSWQVLYPPQRQAEKIAISAERPDVQVPLLEGFTPHETLQLSFYATPEAFFPSSAGFRLDFIASRAIQVDGDGAAALNVVVSRSSPFRNQNIVYVIRGLDENPLRFATGSDAQEFYNRRQITIHNFEVQTLLPALPVAPCPNSPPSRLQIGMRARVTPGDPNALRAGPGTGADIGIIRAGQDFTILDGPQCDAKLGLTWWKVNFRGVIGWTAEGQAGVYWLEPLP